MSVERKEACECVRERERESLYARALDWMLDDTVVRHTRSLGKEVSQFLFSFPFNLNAHKELGMETMKLYMSCVDAATYHRTSKQPAQAELRGYRRKLDGVIHFHGF